MFFVLYFANSYAKNNVFAGFSFFSLKPTETTQKKQFNGTYINAFYNLDIFQIIYTVKYKVFIGGGIGAFSPIFLKRENINFNPKTKSYLPGSGNYKESLYATLVNVESGLSTEFSSYKLSIAGTYHYAISGKSTIQNNRYDFNDNLERAYLIGLRFTALTSFYPFLNMGLQGSYFLKGGFDINKRENFGVRGYYIGFLTGYSF